MIKEILIFTLLITAALSFEYYKPVTIKETSNQDLLDYQLMLSIDTSSLISEGKMKEDCSDLEFYDQGKELPYWIEKGCNTNNTTIWVRLNLSAGQEKEIRMLYSDNETKNKSNGSKVFYFFDDFTEGLGKWENSLIRSNVKDLNYSLDKDAYAEGGVLKLRKTITTSESMADLKAIQSIDLGNFILEEKIKYPGNGFDWPLIAELGEKDNYIRVLFNEYFDDLSIAMKKDSNTNTLVKTGLIRGEWLTIEYKASRNSNTLVRIIKEDGSVLIDWTDVGDNINNYNKFVWFSQGRGAAVGTSTETGDIDYVFVRKYSEKEPQYVIGEEKKTDENLIENKTIYSLIGKKIQLTLKNNKDKEATNIELAPSEGKIDPYFILSLKPGDEKNVSLVLDDEKPSEKEVIINVKYDQGEEKAKEKIVLYDDELLSAIENCRITESSNNCTAIINRVFEFNTSNGIDFDYSMNNVTNVRCFKGTERIEAVIEDSSVRITTKSNGSIKIQCEFTASAGEVEEKKRESYNVTLEKAVTRIPLLFTNEFNHPIEVNWFYERQAPPTYVFNNTQGSFPLEDNATQYVYLTSESVISFKRLGREQAENYSSVVNEHSYSQIPLLIQNNDVIGLNLSWNLTIDNGFEPVVMSGTVSIPSQEEVTVFGIEKNKALKGKIISLSLLNGSIEKQAFNATIEINNSDNISYSKITFKNNTINTNINGKETKNITIILTTDLVDASFEIKGLNNSNTTTAVVEEVIKTSTGDYNFTGNISIGNQSIEGWNCLQTRKEVYVPGNNTVALCSKKDWLELKNVSTKAIDVIRNSSVVKVMDAVVYESSSEYPIPLTLKFKNASTKAVLVQGDNTVFFERMLPVKYEEVPALFGFDYENNEMINVSSDEDISSARISINKEYSKARVFSCFKDCYDRSNWKEVRLYEGYVETRVPVLLIISYENRQENNNEEQESEKKIQEETIDNNETTNKTVTGLVEEGNDSEEGKSEDLTLNASSKAQRSEERLAGNKTSGFVATGNASSVLKPLIFSAIFAAFVVVIVLKKLRARGTSAQA